MEAAPLDLQQTEVDEETWADRSALWQNAHDHAVPNRKRRERRKAPLILCGHGLSIRVDKSTILIRDGNTHYPSADRIWRFFKGDRDLPPRIVVVDGSGEITFDAIAWLAEQDVSLVWLKWDGASCGVMSATGYAADTDLVCWQRETASDQRAQLAFAKRLIVEKLDASIQTLIECFPETEGRLRTTATIRQTRNELKKASPESVSDILGIEGKAAAAYFAAWDGLELKWKGLKRQPIPDEWKCYSSRSSLANGTKPKNRNASHPVNAMLNYGYAVLLRHMQIEAVSEGYDPTIGIMHKPKKGSPAYALEEMALAAVLIDALHAPLEDGEEVFDGVGVNVAAPIFTLAMRDNTVLREGLGKADILACFVGHDARFVRDVLLQDRDNGLGLNVLHMDATNASAALDKRQDGVLVGIAPALLLTFRLHALLLADEGFVGLDNAAIAAHRREIASAHCLADAMAHKPCGFQGHAQGAMQLVRADSLLAGRQQIDRLQPQAQRDMALLEDGADLDVELLPALVALVKADAGRLALHLGYTFLLTAMRADRTIRPDAGFNPGVGGFFVLQVLLRKQGHGLSPCPSYIID